MKRRALSLILLTLVLKPVAQTNDASNFHSMRKANPKSWNVYSGISYGFTTVAGLNNQDRVNAGNAVINLEFGWISAPLCNGRIDVNACNAACEQMNHTAKEKWRYVLNASYSADNIYNDSESQHLSMASLVNTKRININATAHRVLPGLSNASIYLQAGYYGSDSFNVYFVRNLWQCRIGLAFAFFRATKDVTATQDWNTL